MVGSVSGVGDLDSSHRVCAAPRKASAESDPVEIGTNAMSRRAISEALSRGPARGNEPMTLGPNGGAPAQRQSDLHRAASSAP